MARMEIEMKKEFDLLSLGEIMLRLSPPSNERITRGDSLSKQAGGAELNAITGAAMLGLRCGIISKLPMNDLGVYIKNRVRLCGVSDDYLVYDDDKDARLGVYYYESGAYPRKPRIVYDRKNTSINKLTIDDYDDINPSPWNNYKENIVYIISYDTLRNDLDEFNEYTFNYAILDEAQAIKNMQALKTKSVKRITSLNKLVLTGTPIENSVADLWSIFDFLMPSYLFNYDRFRLEIEKGVLMNDDEAYNRLIIKTKPFILRRKKNDVLKDLPDKVEETISISMSKEQRMLYDAYLLQTRKALNQDASNNKIMVLSMLTRLRQICISPALVVDKDLESEKINYCLDMVDNLINTDHKVLIFSQFVSALDIIQNELSKRGIEYFIITGDTSSKRRLEMAEEFNKESSKEKVFLISLKAGGTGLNLVGADTVIHLDPWWNVAIENQASDRAHRIGQERKVTVFKLIMNNSIEEKVIELQKNKKEIADRIISNNDTDISNLSFNDYDYLLS